MPVTVPAGVDVNITPDNVVTVKGPKGTLEQQMHKDMIIKCEGGVLTVERPTENKEHKALHGLTRSLLANMVIGVTDGFKKELQIVGVGYKASLSGNTLVLNLGYSHVINFAIPAGIKITVTPDNKITIEGADKQLVGETAAEIRRFRPPEPYKGKGIRYIDERIVLKEGKSVG
jgi:large subunit ribosomal protein L6